MLGERVATIHGLVDELRGGLSTIGVASGSATKTNVLRDESRMM